MRAVYKRILILLALSLCVITCCRIHYLRYLPSEEESPEALLPQGLHLILNNTDSDLEETRRMESSIERFMAQWEIEGASLAIMKNGHLLYSKGFGKANRETGEPMEVHHILRIASLSKLITATGIMKLCESGRLSLQDHVFGPDGILNDSLFLQIRDKRLLKITVEHLLRHQGGFSNRAGDPLFCMPNVARQLGKSLPLTLDDLVQYASISRLRYEPGSSNIYSNLGYVVLTKVIEKVSGLPYETYMQDSILHPIGCMDMHIGYSDSTKRFPNEVHYYEPSDAEPTESALGGGALVPKSYGGCDLQVLSGAGGWVASPTELMRFITAIDDQDSRPDILTPASIDIMTEKDENRFPIGWMRTTKGNDWTRTGSLAGSSVMLKRQHNGYTWVFITNTSSWSGSRFPRKIENMIRQALDKVKSWPRRDLFDMDTTAMPVVDTLSYGTPLIVPAPTNVPDPAPNRRTSMLSRRTSHP